MITFIFSCNGQGNSTTVCKDCKSFDLAKLSFDQNIDFLTSKTKTTILAYVNGGNDRKPVEKVNKNDKINLYFYFLENYDQQTLGKKAINYNGKFYFHNLQFALNPKKELIACSANSNYEGKSQDIDDFIDDVTKENKDAKMIYFQLPDAHIYQWYFPHKIIQIIKSNSKAEETVIVNGKSNKKFTYYINLNIFNRDQMTKENTLLLNKQIFFRLLKDINYKL